MYFSTVNVNSRVMICTLSSAHWQQASKHLACGALNWFGMIEINAPITIVIIINYYYYYYYYYYYCSMLPFGSLCNQPYGGVMTAGYVHNMVSQAPQHSDRSVCRQRGAPCSPGPRQPGDAEEDLGQHHAGGGPRGRQVFPLPSGRPGETQTGLTNNGR